MRKFRTHSFFHVVDVALAAMEKEINHLLNFMLPHPSHVMQKSRQSAMGGKNRRPQPKQNCFRNHANETHLF